MTTRTALALLGLSLMLMGPALAVPSVGMTPAPTAAPQPPAAMDPQALYYALSTIAQCAAALAALIGFLGMWRLDRLREEDKQCEQEFVDETMRCRGNPPATVALIPGGREAVLKMGRDMVHDRPNDAQFMRAFSP